MLPALDQGPVAVHAGEGVAVEADEDDVDDDAQLHPVLPVEEVLLLRVHELEDLLAQEDDGGEEEEAPDHDGGPGQVADLLPRLEAVSGGRVPRRGADDLGRVGLVGEPVVVVATKARNERSNRRLLLALVFDDALAGVDAEDEAGVHQGEEEVEDQADEEELAHLHKRELRKQLFKSSGERPPHLEPLEVQEALAEGVLEEVVVADLDEVDEHGALAPGLVGDEDAEVHLELAVHVVDVVLGQGDGVVQHVLELGQDVGDLAHDHGQSGGAAVGPGRDVGPVGQEHVGAVRVLVQGGDVERGVPEPTQKIMNDSSPGIYIFLLSFSFFLFLLPYDFFPHFFPPP